MEDRTALLPSRGFDSRSYLMIPKVLDCMPSGVGAGLKHVINSVGPTMAGSKIRQLGRVQRRRFPRMLASM